MGTCQLRKKPLQKNIDPLGIPGGSRSVGNPARKNYLSRKPKKEGQGRHKVLELIIILIMKMMTKINITAIKWNKYIISNSFHAHIASKYIL
jgi:hypothetical protein